VTVQWLKSPADSKWTRCAAALRNRPGVEAKLDVPSANPSTDANRINHGVLAAFRPAGHFQARVVGGEIWARYSPPGLVSGDDPP
jgi:hypothetical protein